MTPRMMNGLKAAAVCVLLLAGCELIATTTRPVHLPDFSGTTLHGERWTLAAARRRGPVIVQFFGTW